MIMAGGTGGHVFPALAVAEWLQSRGVEVVWLGTRGGLEARLVPARNIAMEWIQVGGLRGKGIAGWVSAPLVLLRALYQAMRAIRRHRPRAILGMGGFAAGPGGVAGWLMRVPLLIHEQNAVPGLTNRLLSRLAQRVMEAFPGSFPGQVGAQATGNPVRREIALLPDPEERLSKRSGALRLLVLGGSLGAAVMNETVPAAVRRLPPEERPEILHQAGDRHLDAARDAYRAAQVAAKVVPFVEAMAEAYGWADLVLCRAGALTVSELAAAGVGGLLVPYPYAVDDHQTANARWLAEAGGAELIPQPLFTDSLLAERLRHYHRHRDSLLAMAVAARQVARPEAVERVATSCLEQAGIPLGAADAAPTGRAG